MIDIKILLPELKKLVTELSEDLLARTTSDPGIDAGLRNAYAQIEKGGRTGDPYEVWLEDYLDQVAVAWVLSCVFVRFMEDNDLIDHCWLAGQGERRQKAEDSHELYFREKLHHLSVLTIGRAYRHRATSSSDEMALARKDSVGKSSYF